MKRSDFQKRLDHLKKNKEAVYSKMKVESKDPLVIEYYLDIKNNLSESGIELLETS